jgi:UDP-N-acetylmuramyl pentapeptide phosphotransferase/UDP-N-acetylglucosamine-1-phosphate transferase
MLNFCVGFLISFIVTTIVVRYSHLHHRFSADHDTSGAQKFHSRPVPRVGGAGIFLALVGGILTLYFLRAPQTREFALLVIASTIAFGAGTLEDLTKRVSPTARLLATMLAAAVAIILIDARITHIGVPGIDSVLGIAVVSGALTCIAVAGLANAINIIDGFNGLAAIVAAMMFLSLSYVALQVGDSFVLSVALVFVGATLGFFLWNFPAGLIFLGDGGAYLIGFMLAELAIILVMRHPQVSVWYPMLMFIYPLFETLFSIYRKKFLRGISPGIPDGVHLHMLVYKRLMRWAVGSQDERHRLRRNSFTSPYLWLLSLLAILPATVFWRSTPILLTFIVVFVVTYVRLYWSIVRFKAPRWMIFKKK